MKHASMPHLVRQGVDLFLCGVRVHGHCPPHFLRSTRVKKRLGGGQLVSGSLLPELH